MIISIERHQAPTTQILPYRGGGPALTDLLAGQVQVFFPPMVVSIGQVRAGRLQALAVTSATRSEALPDIPTVGEFVPGYEASVWFGLGAPSARPLKSSTSSASISSATSRRSRPTAASQMSSW